MTYRPTFAMVFVASSLAFAPACGSSSSDDDDVADAACLCDGPNDPDAVPAPDADSDAGTPPAVNPLFDMAGFVHLTERQPGASQLAETTVQFMNGPPTEGFELISESGPCAYYRPTAPGSCDPACDFGEMCSGDDVCVPVPARLSAGIVTITGLAETVTATPDGSGAYTTAGLDGVNDLFAPGDTISVSATGADIAAFNTAVSGVGNMVNTWDSYHLVDGDDNVFSWIVQGDGAAVELLLQIGWDGDPPTDIIYCTGTDADGAITLPQAFVDMFPPFGGVGLLQHPSIMRRVSRQILDSSIGRIEVAAASERTFGVTH